MKTSFLSENLKEKLSFANHAISNKNQLPILSNFLINAEKGILNISATDLEIGIKTEIPAKTEEEGGVTVPAKIFLELVATLSSGNVYLSTKPEGLELINDKIKAVFQTIPAEEFPKLYEKKGNQELVFKKNIIEKDIPKVVFAASHDAGRPALSGVLIRKKAEEDKDLLIVATDGYRLSLKKCLLEKKDQPKEDVLTIVPARVIRELISMTKGVDVVKTYLSKENNQIIFNNNETTLVGRLIEAEFPAFEKIIPNDFSTKSIFDKEGLKNAVRACYIFTKNAASIVKISITKEKLVVYANSPSVGENTVEVDAKTTGEENEIAFNARYLLDLLSNIEEDTMSFEMTGPLNPGVFKIEGDDSFLHLIMPIRVQQEA